MKASEVQSEAEPRSTAFEECEVVWEDSREERLFDPYRFSFYSLSKSSYL